MADASQEVQPKSDPHAWRRKPRKFAPKSRLGCKTCKLRRIKCDLAQPSCTKCTSTGRTCDGYGAQLLPTYRESRSSSFPRAGKPAQGAVAKLKKLEPKIEPKLEPQQLSSCHEPDRLNIRSLAPLLVRPMVESTQAHTMEFFQHVSIRQLTEYHYNKAWCDALMYFSQTVASVRYAAIALASVQRCQDDWPAGHGPLVYYNLAIRHLLTRQTDDSTEATAITLLVCYLLICFDHVAGHDGQAIQHLKGGVALLTNIDEVAAGKKKNGTSKESGIDDMVHQISRQIHRLDQQAVVYLLPWAFLDAAEMPAEVTAEASSPFRSHDHATDNLLVLIARVMRLCNDEIEHPASASRSGPRRTALRAQLAAWLTRFEAMLGRRGVSRGTEARDRQFASLLYLQHGTIAIMLNAFGRDRELMFDEFLPDFQRCLDFARQFVAGQEGVSLSSPRGTYTPELGVIPVLYIIGWKCRHPVLRREALGLLRKLRIQEANWDSVTTAKIIERAIEIEEGEFWKNGRLPEMNEITLPQRIGLFYWERTRSGIDLTYMFCTRDESFTEPLNVSVAERLLPIRYRG